MYVHEIDSVPIYSVRTKVFLKPRELSGEEASARHTGHSSQGLSFSSF